MVTVNIHEAKTQLSKLVDRAAKGEPFVIAKAGKPLVKVTALDAPAAPRRLGFLASFVAAVVANIIGYLVHLIPQYPDTTTPGFNGGPGGILGGLVGALILLVVTGLVAGAIGYLGARIATRRHVYYTGYEE